jgi:hypothetical protein
MANWFEEFRSRTHSFDMTLLAKKRQQQRGGSKASRFARMFRSKSEEGMQNEGGSNSPPSPSTTDAQSPGAPRRRRMMRIVRNDESAGEEYENPYLVRHYTKEYWEQQMEEARALQLNVNVPYTTNSDHTILKKHHSADAPASPPIETDPLEHGSPQINRHACFRDEVEVMEFKADQKISKQMVRKRRERLLDSNSDNDNESTSPSPPPFKQIVQKQRSNEYGLAKQLSVEEDEINSSDADEEPKKRSSKTGGLRKLFTRHHHDSVDALCESVEELNLDIVVEPSSLVQA